MTAARVRRPIHRGSVLAAGLFVDAGSLGEEGARARLLGVMGAGAEVARSGEWIVVRLRAPVRMSTFASPAGLLVRYGDLLSSAPMEKDEIDVLNTARPTALIIAGGEPVKIALDEAHGEDPAAWIDVSDFEVARNVASLGSEQAAPKAGVAARDVDVRASLGVEAAPPEAASVRRALWGDGEGSAAAGAAHEEGSGATGGQAAARGGRVWGPLARFFSALASLLERLIPGIVRGGAGGESAGSSPAGRGSTSSARALAVREEAPGGAAGRRSWLSALSRGLRELALRALVWSRLAGIVGRRQAEYLSRMLEMFERGDLENALRHAIPLGAGDPVGDPVPPALGTPSPRSELTIVPGRRRAAATLYSGPHLFAELRRRYRRAFEQLERAGEVEKAAFVLAELLGAHEEAVSFLERHGRLRLAAEIAEARGLAPGLVVRQWFLAGDARRAVRLARAHGAFSDAVHRLKASRHAREATAMRLLWADTLAEAGQLGAAVQVIWPVEEARTLAAEWIDRAIALGGPSGAQMVLRKARLFPESFSEARARVLALLREPGEEGAVILRALAAEIESAPGEPSNKVLATPVLRALLRGEPPGGDEGSRRVLAERLADASGDALVREELRRMWKKKPEAEKIVAVRVLAAGFTRCNRRHSINEDTLLMARLSPLEPRSEGEVLDAGAGDDGVVLAVLDGMGGYNGGEWASQLAASTIARRLEQAFGLAQGVSSWAEALREAVVVANHAVHSSALADARHRGAGCTVVAATVAGGTLIVAHAGDSRAYLCRGGKLTALTRDHSLINEYEKHRLEPPARDIPANVITRALGVVDSIEVDVATVPLREGDVLFLCTNGVWEPVPEDRLARILSGQGAPADLARELQSECVAIAEAPPDDQAVVVARFSGELPAASPGAPVEARPHIALDGGTMASLRASPEPRLVRRGRADTGAVPISDAAELPDGRLLVALGELGAWLLSREGRVIARFAEPSEHIVMSDHGDRALLLASRGEATRIARLDLVRRRKQAWCDARITAFARDFDGSIWYVAMGDILYSIDATQQGWEHLWQERTPGEWVQVVGRDGQSLSAALLAGDAGLSVWTWDLPSHRLRRRDAAAHYEPFATCSVEAVTPSGGAVALVRPVAADSGVKLSTVLLLRNQNDQVHLPGPGKRDAWRTALSEEWFVTPAGEDGAALDVIDAGVGRPRLRVDLAGSRPSGRICGDHLLVFDDRGRLLVISLRTGGVIREIRLS